MSGKLQSEVDNVAKPARDVMFDELQELLAKWCERGLDEETILSRFHCIAVQSMQASGVTFDDMVELLALHYGMVKRARISHT